MMIVEEESPSGYLISTHVNTTRICLIPLVKTLHLLVEGLDSTERPLSSTPFGNTTSHVPGLTNVRRPRADTMPSRTTVFPTIENTGSSPTTSGNDSDIYLGNTTSNKLAIPSAASDTGRRRSGSVTLLSSSDNTTRQDYGNALFTPGFPPYHMMEETASTTVASTLASLGLGDTSTTSDMLPMGFSPFSPQSRSSVMQRPRAISLGMADDPQFDETLSSFTPFDMNSLQSTLSSSPAAQQVYQQQQQPSSSSSKLGQQVYSDTQRSLRISRSSGNLMDLSSDRQTASRFDSSGFYDSSIDDLTHQDDINAMPSASSSSSALLDSPSSVPAQIPSRALWLGNVNPSVSVNDLMQQFSLYGHVESARILSDKECAFVNFSTVESAVAAKNDLETRLGSMLGGTSVRVGFGKADVAVAMALTNEAGPNAQGPTRALWVGNIPANMNTAILQAIFQAFGPIESVRVLSHKNCGFVNFEHQEDAVRARKNLQNKEILGPGSGTVRIGFAKAPSAEDINNGLQQGLASHNAPTTSGSTSTKNNSNNHSLSTDTYQATQWATAMMMTTMMMNASGKQPATQPSLYTAIAAERQFIMQQLCQYTDTVQLQQKDQQNERIPVSYYSVIPSVPELSSDRTLEPLRLRDMRKRLENGQALQDVEIIAYECMNEIVELCSDYIGNTVIQKLFEQCTEATKQTMLERIAPYLAAIGVHKNGTWAAQKIIDYANTPGQLSLIRQYIAPYVPLLLLDQFGNYVVQCCLRLGAEHNQYIFDAIVDKCWEIGQGRFGARAVRAILESNVVTKEQQVYCAAAIVQNAVLLTTNANGTLLLVWLLDTSELAGRYRVLYPRLLPYLSKLCTHKLGSMTVYKIIQQQEEPDTSHLFLNALTTDAPLLDDILRDQIHGLGLIQKILALPHIHDQRGSLVRRIRASLDRLQVQHIQSYKKLIEELDSVPSSNTSNNSGSGNNTPAPQPSSISVASPSPSSASSSSNPLDTTNTSSMDMVSWMKNPQAVAMMANMYAAAMTAAATSQQQQQQMPSMLKVPELPQFNHILKSLLTSTPSTTDVNENTTTCTDATENKDNISGMDQEDEQFQVNT
ncbi:uncharacterized protein BX664DRAFT_318573 [Halteromyces radiatus]|uniref:uncharacterized protein n=1 Tax=Halteromyces radiatus TaxID=101107 RepID=UPI002220DD71|nr:uncharacterized protein BX664DRAFT_318573 [Halteromyces radiatus]KAI8076855.1 hypothetical protein BX664DRAFT_318573 [Halteromyces radiatus]